ncbi:methyltransferase [Crossiella sp. CA198]|uniref:methyltransferase n=1 Tax=Crossiella sp. CA198 TaxID=3455607 RepID=UPI003F8D398B
MTTVDPLSDLVRMASMLTPSTIRVAATLRLPDLIESGVTTLTELAEKSGTDVEALGRTMHYLVLIGLFTETGPQTYAVTEVGRVLTEEHGAGMRRWLDLEQPGRRIEARMEPAMAGLLTSVRTGGPNYEEVYGRSFWQDLDADAELAESFNGSLAVHVNGFAPEVASAYDWSSVKHVVDVGGGTGALVAELLSAHPELKATLVELDTVVADAPPVLAAAGVADRCEIVGGSFFDPLPTGGDVYLIANCVHNWNDQNGVKILSRLAEAAGPGGRVVLVERLLDEEREGLFAAYANLLMMVLLDGKERTEKDFRELAAKAGLRLDSVRQLEYPALALLEFTVTG